MLSRALLETLHCPYCGSPLILEKDLSPEGDALIWGVVRCHCYRYAIVDGILILQQYSAAFNTEDVLVRYLDADDRAGALGYALSALSPVVWPRPALQKLIILLGRRAGPLAALLRAWQTSKARALIETKPTLREALYALRPPIYADYLFYRHANPSFLASLPLLSVFENLSGGIVLDLACGIGHSSYLISRCFPRLQVIAADHDFLNLYLAKRFIAPAATFLCLSVEAPLPFADETLSGVWCMDGVHYVRAKAALGQELRRATQDDGIWVFPHLHNALHENPSPGIPVGPEDYLRCFEALNPRLFVEADMLRAFTETQDLDLSARPAEEALRGAPVTSLVASSRDVVWRHYSALAHTLAEITPLALNPIYASHDQDSEVELDMAWPSPALEAECEEVKHVIPEHQNIERGLFERLRSGQLAREDRSAIDRLIQSCAILPLPPGYV